MRDPQSGTLAIPLVVDERLDGYRLDRFLHERIRRLSRTRIQAIIGAGQVFRGRAAEPERRCAVRVSVGERITVERPAPVEPEVTMDYDVVHRDGDLLVIDKPAGLPVHPSARYHLHTLTALMRTRLGDGHGWEMAHRLDRETSGLMVFGRRAEASDRSRRASGGRLKRAFAERRVTKTYLALVRGVLGSPREIDMALGPAMGSAIRIKMGPCAVGCGGLKALTHVEPAGFGEFRGEPVTLVRCRPHTGRQHQIRVHLAEIGHPVLGDKLYAVPEAEFLAIVEGGRPISELESRLGLARHALHAARLELDHPATTARLAFMAPWPALLSAILPLPAALERSLLSAP